MKKIILKIEGMTCSACSYGLEKYLQKQDGIISVNVNLILAIATIEYENLSIKEIEEYIKKAGFKSNGEFSSFDEENRKKKTVFLLLMGMLLTFLMYITMNHMLGLPQINWLSRDNPINYALVSLMITVIFLIYGKDVLKSGLKNLYHRMPNMDTLVLLSVSASFFYSLYGLINICFFKEKVANNLYFEAICMVIYFVKLGRFIEDKNKNKTRSAVKNLVQITPKEAIIKINNEEKKITIDEIKMNDLLICRSGEKIAVDGEVVFGKTYVDESFITGESKPVLKEKGSKVIAGSVSYNGIIEYQAKRIGRNSTISEIVKLVVEATNQKNKIQRIADQISGYFVYGIIIIAVLTLFGHLIVASSYSEAISHFATVLVVACPCALGLAVPLVIVVSNGVCAKKGLFVRNSEVLEEVRKIDTIVFDKTGTLTYGKLKIAKLYNYSDYDKEELLNLIGNIEDKSSHPIKSAFKIKKKLSVRQFETIDGIGIKAIVNNKEYYLGNKKILKKLAIVDSNNLDYQELVNDGCTIIYVIENLQVIGLIGVKDIVRKEAKRVIEKLNERKITIVLLTGDNYSSAELVAKELGITKVIANVLPKEKADIIKEMINNNQRVMMIGDGINDAPALINATVGISISDGTDIAIDSSDVILMNNNLDNILDLIVISKYSYKIICENLFWAFLYNLWMIPIAIGLFNKFGLSVNPMIASIMMTLSSLIVVLNSLRVGRIK